MERRKMEQKCYSVIVSLLLASLLLSACSEEDSRQRGINGYLYVAEELSMDQEEKTDYRICGNYLYYLYPSEHTLYRIPLNGEASAEGTGAKSELVVASSSERPVLCYTVDDDMSVYYYRGVMQKKGYYNVMVKGELVKCQEDGTQIYRRTFDIGAESGVEAWLISLAVDGSRRSFLLAGESIYITDASGESLGSVSVQEYRPGSQSSLETEKLLEGADGRVYYYMIDQYKPDTAVYEILGNGPDFRLERLTAFNMETGNGSFGKVYGSPAGLLYSNNGLLQLYRQEEKISRSDLLRWSDSNLGSNPVEVIWISEEKLAAAYNMDQGHKLYLLTKTRVEEVPEREELVLAGIYISGKLENWVTEFNQSNEQYHITIEPLTRSESDLTRLDITLVSSNPPDILDMTYMNVMKYANKQMLEDLSSYLEMEGLPGKEGCLDNFVDGYTVGGRLVGIPKYITIDVLMGRESQLGSKIGWTMEEVYALSNKYPESRLMSMDNFEYALEELCADYILDAFIDWEKGDCFFDSGEFRNLMQWLDEHTGRVDRIYAEGDYRNGVVPDDMLLLDNEIGSANNLMYYRALFGDDMTVMGFPTVDGSVYYRGVPEMLIGITSGSRHKEGAGQFMEFFLSKELEWSDAFSIYKDDLTQLLEDMMTPEYLLDPEGELWLENGMPVPRAKGSYVVDGEVVDYYAMTQEQADEIWNVIAAADFTPVGGVRKEVINIIMEEMRSYLYREKGLDEVTDIIQNRVRTLMQESM